MRLFEFYDKSPTKSSEEFFNRQEEIERTFNREAYQAQEDMKSYYRKHHMDQGNAVVMPTAAPEEDKWSNVPEDKEATSPGYRGLQNVKRRAGHCDVDLEVNHQDPHDEVALPKDEEEMIKNAKWRLGLI